MIAGEADFREYVAEKDDIFDRLDGCIDFGLGGAEGDDLLFLAAGMEYSCLLAEGEVKTGVGLGFGVCEVCGA